MQASRILGTSARASAVVAIAVTVQLLISFITQIVLARTLAPEIFGQLAFIATATMFFNALTNLRGDAYVIHQKESPQRAVDVAFTLELLVAAIAVILMLAIAPLIMAAIGKEEFTIHAQFLTLSYFYNPFSRVRCLLERELSFVQSKSPQLVSQVIAAVSSIGIAHAGYGIWSLVWYRLSLMLGELVILWIIVPYRPRLRWDTAVAKKMLAFSWPLVFSGCLSFSCYNIDYFIIGYFLDDGAVQLGYYWLGFQAATYVLVTRRVFFQVLFPVFSRVDNDNLKKETFLKLSRVVAGAFVVLTIIALFFGKDAIMLVYGSNWEPAVIPFQIICIVVMMRAVNGNLGYYFYSAGKTHVELVSVSFYLMLLFPTAYYGTIHFGIQGTALAVLAAQALTDTFIYERYVKPMTGHGVLYFFFWPWVITGASFAAAMICEYRGFSFSTRSVWCLAVLFCAYAVFLRPIVHDIKTAFQMMRSQRVGSIEQLPESSAISTM